MPSDEVKAGVTLLQEEQYEEAIRHFDRYLEDNPDSVEVLHYKVRSLTRLNRFEEALEIIDRMMEIDPDELWISMLKTETAADMHYYKAGKKG